MAPRVEGRPTEVRAGDVILCCTPGQEIGWLIRRATKSEASHAALVTRADPSVGLFEILEVGARIREARIDEFPGREWIAYRPTVDSKPITAELGWTIARDTLAFLHQAGVLGGIYPFWQLPAYLLSRDWRGKLLMGGPREVCSATTARALVSHGCELWVWHDDDHVRVESHDQVEGITPGDLIRTAIEQGWLEIAWTDGAPVI